MRIKPYFFLIVAFAISSCKNDYSPKPRGYFKIDLPYDEILPILAGIGLGLSKDYNVSSNIDKNINE